MTMVRLVPTGMGKDDINCPSCGAGYQFDDDSDF